jgi:hypothetical protein
LLLGEETGYFVEEFSGDNGLILELNGLLIP